jgi:long-subunit acyl-CoA synthetase (AMP-forming)
VHGEVLAKRPNVFSGYRHLPDKTAEVFTGDGYFRTGRLYEN